MNLLTSPNPTRRAFQAGFTIVELMVAGAIGVVLLGGIMTFTRYAMAAFSGITTQSTINQRAGNVIERIQERVARATVIQCDSAGNTLTLGFDADFSVDSDSDGKPYNDRDRSERFQFLGVNTTNSANCSSNRLLYFPDITKTNNRILVPSGLRDLPGRKIFVVTNENTVIIRFGIADSYAGDRYQAIDIQGMAVTLNRPTSATNFILLQL